MNRIVYSVSCTPEIDQTFSGDAMHLLYAPDVAQGPDGRYYLYYALDFTNVISVAVCDTPAGKYEFLDYVRCADGTHPGELYMTQASQALPLFWGMVPEDKKEDVVNAFRYTLNRDGAFICREIGLPYVIQTARRYGMNDIICKFILKEEHPSYYAFILDGETTLGEYWESNPRSHCHDMMGHIIEWYYNGIAGILPDGPGFSDVTICPYLPESMHEFTCSYQSANGEIRVHVKEEEKKIFLNVFCAEEITCRIDSSNLAGRGKTVVVNENKSD